MRHISAFCEHVEAVLWAPFTNTVIRYTRTHAHARTRPVLCSFAYFLRAARARAFSNVLDTGLSFLYSYFSLSFTLSASHNVRSSRPHVSYSPRPSSRPYQTPLAATATSSHLFAVFLQMPRSLCNRKFARHKRNFCKQV